LNGEHTNYILSAAVETARISWIGLPPRENSWSFRKDPFPARREVGLPTSAQPRAPDRLRAKKLSYDKRSLFVGPGSELFSNGAKSLVLTQAFARVSTSFYAVTLLPLMKCATRRMMPPMSRIWINPVDM
jgi:hypothetical protein